MPPDSLTEYLYVDAGRLNAYYNQVSSGDLVQKVPVWRVALGLTGPRVEGQQSVHLRLPSQHEKVTTVLAYLKKNALLRTFRPQGEDVALRGRSPFRKERLSAYRFYLPRAQRSDTARELRGWIALPPPEDERVEQGIAPGSLILVEDGPRDDDAPPYSTSGHTALTVLASEFEVNGSRLERLGEVSNGSDLLWADPIVFFEKVGARVIKPRHVDVVYRIRDMTVSIATNGEEQLATIGYPIVICDSIR